MVLPNNLNSNSFLSSITLLHRQNIVWNFFATSHGKGPVEGSGTVKWAMAKEISGKAEVSKGQMPKHYHTTCWEWWHFPKNGGFWQRCSWCHGNPKYQTNAQIYCSHPYAMDVKQHAKSASLINHYFRDGGSNTLMTLQMRMTHRMKTPLKEWMVIILGPKLTSITKPLRRTAKT